MVAIEVPFYTAPVSEDPNERVTVGYLTVIASTGDPCEARITVHGLDVGLKVSVLLGDLERAVSVAREQLAQRQPTWPAMPSLK